MRVSSCDLVATGSGRPYSLAKPEIQQGRAKLQAAGELLTAPIPEQANEFEWAWSPEDDWDYDTFWITKSGIGWTPSGLVWKVADGNDFWTGTFPC